MVSLPTNIKANEAMRRFSDLLDRVRDRGESFVIERDGEEVALLARPHDKPSVTFSELVVHLAALRTGEPTFAKDLEDIHTAQPTLPESLWES